MGDLLGLLAAQAALAIAYGLARWRGRHRLAREWCTAGVALAVTVSLAHWLLALAGDREELAVGEGWAAGGGAIVVPGVLAGRLVAAGLRAKWPATPRDGGWVRGCDDRCHR